MTTKIRLAACILFAGSIHAQNSAAPKRLVVNGHTVKAKLLEMYGKHFVSVEDLAQSLGGSVAYTDKQITLTFSQPTSPDVPPSEVGGGTDPKLTGVRSAVAELRSAVDTGVTYSHYMEKLQHFAAEISLAEEAGVNATKLTKYKEALDSYKAASMAFDMKINQCTPDNVSRVPETLDRCVDFAKASAEQVGLQIPKQEITAYHFLSVLDDVIQAWWKKAEVQVKQ